jgi:hypothetical protein
MASGRNLAADIVGCSRLMGKDETTTVRNLKAHRTVVLPLVAQHGGIIISTAGDGLVAEFPSAVRAVECAVAQAVAHPQHNPITVDWQLNELPLFLCPGRFAFIRDWRQINGDISPRSCLTVRPRSLDGNAGACG